MWYESQGILRYSIDSKIGHKLIVEVDKEIARYYRSFIPKYHTISLPAYSSHISIVRKELPPNLNVWGKYEGKSIDFWYGDQVKTDDIYLWLTCYSTTLENIRLELGLPLWNEIEKPLGKFRQSFHVTLANFK
jgi:hypothetical protein